MSGTEGFFTRWSRLKRKSELASPTEGPALPEDESSPRHAAPPGDASLPGHESPSRGGSPSGDSSSVSVFDPASLPSIESIVADSDIRQFLQADVPPELTRAALRSAWSADPAIRDFVGIAESQWDFNNAAAMPGFGPVRASDYIAAQMIKNLTQVSHSAADTPDHVVQLVQRGPEPLKSVPEIACVAATPIAYADDPQVAEANLPSRHPPAHGGALPK
jgi:hypothetical protein